MWNTMEKPFNGKGIYIILFLCITAVCGETCAYYDNSYWPSTTSYMYCSTECCGSMYNRYCCSTNVGVIVGAVIGSIAFVAIVVSIIVAVCCCCRKSQGRSGQVFHPATTTTTVFGVQSNIGYTQPSYGQPTPGQPGYGQPGYGQPGYSQPGYGPAGYSRGGYTNQGFPGQMPTSNVQPGTDQKWEPQPPPYEPPQTANPS